MGSSTEPGSVGVHQAERGRDGQNQRPMLHARSPMGHAPCSRRALGSERARACMRSRTDKPGPLVSSAGAHSEGRGRRAGRLAACHCHLGSIIQGARQACHGRPVSIGWNRNLAAAPGPLVRPSSASPSGGHPCQRQLPAGPAWVAVHGVWVGGMDPRSRACLGLLALRLMEAATVPPPFWTADA